MKKCICLLGILIVLFFLSSCSQSNEYQQSRTMMDTVITITVNAGSSEEAEEAFEEAFSEIKRIENKFTIHKNSTAYRLNKEGQVKADEEFISVITQSKSYAESTNGSFDITVQPLLELYEESFEVKKRPPTANEINKTLKLVNASSILIENGTVILPSKSYSLTLGGIVKGYAIDRAVDVLKDNGINSALVNAGGDMYGYGKKQNDDLWKIAIENPNEKGYLLNIALEDEAVATSGNYERYFNENMSFHHIVNPKTGYSANNSISVTVLAPNATMADALSTGIFVMGPVNGLDLIEDIDNAEAMIIASNRSIYYSNEFPE